MFSTYKDLDLIKSEEQIQLKLASDFEASCLAIL